MLRQIQIISNKINNKVKSTNYYFLGFLLLVCYNYYALYNYLLDKNYNLILFYFVYLFLLYSFFNLFSYIILFITISVFQLLTIDKYIKNSSIIENHEPGSVQKYRQQNRIAYSQGRRRQRQRQRQRQGQRQRGAWNNYQGYIDAEENEYGELGARIQKSSESRARKEKANAEAVTKPIPDLAYDYILAHLPNCSNKAIALKALPPMPVAT